MDAQIPQPGFDTEVLAELRRNNELLTRQNYLLQHAGALDLPTMIVIVFKWLIAVALSLLMIGLVVGLIAAVLLFALGSLGIFMAR